ncbi:MAG: aminoacyltransferase [Coriobacteriaceae bacterium]|nr:aminoacyltransferase [Coriobacteriaceae bacterium]
MQVNMLTEQEYECALASFEGDAPIEQLPVWQRFEATIPGRAPWGSVGIEEDGELVAVVCFTEFETHGYRYLRARHAPVWRREPTAEEERAALAALVSFVRARDRRQAFLRIAVREESDLTRPCLSTLPYDTTVVIDVTGTEDDILARMKPRGRRDVRKALRECQLAFADETARASEDFDPYYRVMLETAERDGFSASPASLYRDMLRVLGPDHCRLFAGRDGDEVITWTIATLSGHRATRYYGASRSGAARALATDRLIFFECCELGRAGIREYDQMGIGSAFAPEMMSLNTFKTKFAKDGVRPVAPDRDVPVKRAFYGALVRAKGLRTRLRSAGKEA